MKFLKSEKGQALPLVMIVITIGALVIPSFLGNAGSSLIGSRVFTEEINAQYACDAGAEHAIWSLACNGLTANVSSAGDTVDYMLPETVNGASTNVTVSNCWETIAGDGFESGDWSGGSGWLDNWYHEGNASVNATGSPYEGSYHLRLSGGTGYVTRAVDLSLEVNTHLQLQARAESFSAGAEAYLLVSSNGTGWTTAYTWDESYSDGLYHYYDIDLSGYELSGEFWIAFESNMAGDDYFYVDNIEVKWVPASYEILASDSFESGDWSGGSGWLDDWYHEGNASVNATGSPYEGSFHLRLSEATGNVTRAVDLSEQSSARLRFWAKADSFESGAESYCLVSSNGADWTTAYTWDESDDDGQYHYYDIDLTGYEFSSEFWISFRSSLFDEWDYFYVDNLVVVGMRGYGISSEAGSRAVKALVEIDGGTVSVISWYIR